MKIMKNNLLLISIAVLLMFAMMVTAPEESNFEDPSSLTAEDINGDLSAEQIGIVVEQRPDLITRLNVDQIRQYGMRNLNPNTLAFVNMQTLTGTLDANDAENYFSGNDNSLPRKPLTTEEIVLYNKIHPEVEIEDSLILQAEGLTFGNDFIESANGKIIITESAKLKLGMTPDGYLTDGTIIVKSGEVSFNDGDSYYLGANSEIRTVSKDDMVRTNIPTTLHMTPITTCTQCITLDHNSRNAFIDGDGITLQLGPQNNNWKLNIGPSEGISYILDRNGDQALKIKNGMIYLNPDRVDTGFATVTDRNGNELGFDSVSGDCALARCGEAPGITGAMIGVSSKICEETGMIYLKVLGSRVYTASMTSTKEEIARLMEGFTGEVKDDDEYTDEFLKYVAANIRHLEISTRVDTDDIVDADDVVDTTVDYVDEVMDIDDIPDMPTEIQKWIQFRVDNRAAVAKGGKTVTTYSRTPTGEASITITMFDPSGNQVGSGTFTGEEVTNVALRSWLDPDVNVADEEPHLLMDWMLANQ